MRKLLLLFVAALFVVACKKEVNHEEVVMNAARQYYGYLLKGEYEAFVDGTYHKYPVHASYRSELIDNAKMFIAQQKAEHDGIADIEMVMAQVDTASNTANVFLTLKYGDKSHEQVVMPMIKKDGLWYMR
ncbi:MAG: hypothetical protein ACTTIF_01670 [Prevotella sp.]|mgnify:FL=1